MFFKKFGGSFFIFNIRNAIFKKFSLQLHKLYHTPKGKTIFTTRICSFTDDTSVGNRSLKSNYWPKGLGRVNIGRGRNLIEFSSVGISYLLIFQSY